MYDLCISIPVHESPLSLDSQINQILHFTNNSIIIIHINKQYRESYLNEAQKNEAMFLKNNRVLINPTSYITNWGDGRLFLSHHINYIFATKEGIRAKYYVHESSNTMLVRHAVEDYIYQFDCVDSNPHDPENNWWKHTRNYGNHEYFAKWVGGWQNMRMGQNEGTYFPFNNFFEVSKSINGYLNKYNLWWEGEEIIYPTLYHHLFPESKKGKAFVRIFYGNYNNDPNEEKISEQAILRIKNCEKEEENNIYAVKPIPRESAHPLRHFVENLK